jgi:type VI secretion system secreted protein Hcp
MNSRSISALVPRFALCILGLTALAMAPAVNAQTLDTFMHIDGVPGDSTAIGHENDIVLRSYSQSFGTKNCSRVVAQKFIDRSSPALIARAAGNILIPSVIISIRKAGESPIDFFKAILQTVLIERVDVGDDTGTLSEQVVLKPRTIRIEFRPQNADGSFGAAIVTNIDCS